ncbi:peptidase inhibitor family I36 protein [Streptomyces cinnabarinus]|uniref:Peptidase inhibitor family I36 protein n=1 Tax=Streptomyces cinnabarinus TaxID=67287 RepID=A0ABY7KVG4_9ACTN|nr:peptidase inhibitor family I36 protein [Streptomyces cinnabarinus]WAZ26726.1 peptidase inhibitor family I36 protein [Streptomyces cinnabarinus]
MNFKGKLATVALVGSMAVSGMAATAPSAAAVGGCPSGKLCLYDDPNYAHLDITSTSTKACFSLTDWNGFSDGIGSYVNNLPVPVDVYTWTGSVYLYDGRIRAGGFSSNAGSKFGSRGTVCTGGLTPPGW